VVFLKFVSILSQKSERLLFFKNVMNRHYSTLQRDNNAVCLICFYCVLRKQLRVQISREFRGRKKPF
jgi:hypothetical protein